MKTLHRLEPQIACCLCLGLLAGCSARPPRAELVVLISLDGATPQGLVEADAPHTHALLAAGTQSRGARTIPPCKTLPCHISMLSGVTAEKHGITQNDSKEPLPTVPVPTVFDVLDDAGMDSLMIAGKYKMLALRSGHYAALDDIGHILRRETRRHTPRFVFIHSAEPDITGHEHGWMSPQYLDAIHRADRMVGEAVAWVRGRGLWDRTLILLSADHGGSGKTHKVGLESDMIIPWIASGGLARGRELPDGAQIHDIAPTVLAALGLPIPESCEGVAMAPLIAPELAVAASPLKPAPTQSAGMLAPTGIEAAPH